MEAPPKTPLAGLLPQDLAPLLEPFPPFRARQVLEWVRSGASSFAAMSSLPLRLRAALEERFTLRATVVEEALRDRDGAVKLRVRLPDALRIEAVLLRDRGGRATACISTQAGCPAGCVFCKTGSLGFARNLSAAEIAEQFLHLKAIEPAIGSIVVMGMGEPLLNLAALRAALAWLCAPEGLGISPRRITLSTCGLPEGIASLAREGPAVRLAISLCTASQALRERLMPIARTVPLEALRESLVRYQEARPGRVTLEAVLLHGLNTRQQDARALAAFVQAPPALNAI
ncbi:MAG: radical SAM protein, partial [Treponema sp.]|nr:radical SAM protein [Treponema sp.]